tara:strand:+ start:477 stop:680 length:204 start_codon:yes stop_codon:yes gene_type:complete
MVYRAPLLLDDNMIVSRRGVRVLLTTFVLDGLSHNCNLVAGGKDFGDLKILGRIRTLTAELGVYGGG